MTHRCPAGASARRMARNQSPRLLSRAIRAGLFLSILVFAGCGSLSAEPVGLLHSQIQGNLTPVLQSFLAAAPSRNLIYLEPAPPVREPDITEALALRLLPAGAGTDMAARPVRIAARDVMTAPVRRANAAPPKFEPFALVSKMPDAYAHVMFGMGSILLAVSLALGYVGRRITPYAEAPTDRNPDPTRPLAAIVIEPTAGCCRPR